MIPDLDIFRAAKLLIGQQATRLPSTPPARPTSSQ
jgi:hypothetical protein